jgi:peptide/nickel transport system permease protein
MPTEDRAPSVPSPWRESTLGRLTAELLRNRLALLGMVVLVIMVLMAVFAPVLIPYDPQALDMPNRFAPPSAEYPFGTDEFGRDTLSRMIVASRMSVLGSIVAVTVAVVVGVPWGLVSGFFRGPTEAVLMMVIDFLLAVPSILLAMTIIAILGRSSMNALLAIAIANLPAFARLARAATLVETERDYVLASRCIGARTGRLLFKVILPNACRLSSYKSRFLSVLLFCSKAHYPSWVWERNHLTLPGATF